jgi:membrane associated rhomboid family serine protease
MNRITDTVKHLIIVNVLVYLATNFLGNIEDNYRYLALYGFGSPDFKPYQLFTHMFMHADYVHSGLTHIAFNMFALYSFGSALEEVWGGKKFLFFYITCGLVAGLTNNLVNYFIYPDLVSAAVGASGAIYGLLVAFGFMYPNATLGLMFIPVPIKAKYFIPILVGLDLFSGVTGYSIFGGGIAHFAHVGGALAGFILMLIWKNSQFDKHRWN